MHARLVGILFLTASDAVLSTAPLESQAPARRDSAGVVIVTSPPGTAERPSRWTVDTVPDLQLGVASGDPRYEFSRITGVGALPNGEIIVVDGASAQLRFFDARGTFVRRAGGRGNGPGEFLQPRLVPAQRFDSILIADSRRGRLTTLRLDGSLVSTAPLTDRSPVIGQVAPGLIAVTSTISVFATESAEVRRSPYSVRILSIGGATRVDTLVTYTIVQIAARGPSGVNLAAGPPFAVFPRAAAGQGAVFTTDGMDPAIRRYDPSGRLTVIFHVGRTLPPVTREEVSDSLDAVLRGWTDGPTIRRIAGEIPIARTRPAWDDLVIDAEGNVWAAHARSDRRQPRHWTVVSPDGVVFGTVSTPADVIIRYIGRDFVLGLWRDADAVEYVRRYRLQR